MKTIFEPFAIGPVTVKNRIVRSATLERLAENGRITPAVVDVYETLARGGAGLIITGMAAVGPYAGVGPTMIEAHHPEFVGEARRLTDAVHRHGAAVALQAAHCGLRAEPDADGFVWGPSPLPGTANSRALTAEGIRRVAAAFTDTALRAKEAGFDMIQLHGAHGFLLNQFLSPHFNRREDGYGGSFEHRARMLFEVYGRVRAAVGPNFPVIVKLSCSDFLPDGQTEDDFLRLSRRLGELGIDAIEVSGGLTAEKETSPIRPGIDSPEKEAYFAPAAKALANEAPFPVISVGGYRSYGVVRDVIENSAVAAVALCRPLIADPDLPNRWRSGDTATSECICCGRCSKPHGHFYCKQKMAGRS
ncbi:MAG: NADH:flavin oxidoreductase [Clostridiales bacterium]|jgi:2,4-dienoyl-CoA reductase-like NADH-dependent reductase (Old Yellow Enzyme family)|nr:NADH:flavin oxidoreductase [Clostridiales bacterium]